MQNKVRVIHQNTYKPWCYWLARVIFAVMLAGIEAINLAHAQDNERWEIHSQGNGLTNDAITSLVLDEGIVWVGTTDGLNRFDGQRWETFTHDGYKWKKYSTDDTTDATEQTQLSRNYIKALLLDQKGYLWVGSYEGVDVIDTRQFNSVLEPHLQVASCALLLSTSSRIVNVLKPSRDGGVWIGTVGGAIKWTSERGCQGEPQPLVEGESIWAIWEQDIENVWFGTENGRLIHLQANGSKYEYIPNERWRINALLMDNESNLWVGTADGLCQYNLDNMEAGCRLIELPDIQPPNETFVNGLYSDANDFIWVATDDGLWQFQGEQLIDRIQPRTENPALNSDQVSAVAQDQDGHLWVGTTGGLAQKRVNTWTRVMSKRPEQDENNIQIVIEDINGTLWVGMTKGLFWQDSIANWSPIPELRDMAVQCLLPEPDGSLWVCGERGVRYVNPSKQVKETSGLQELQELDVAAIQRGPNGSLWFATDDGARRCEETEENVYRCNPEELTNRDVTSIVANEASGLWFGTVRGISFFDGQQWISQFECDQSDTVHVESLVWDQLHEMLWVGANDDGLYTIPCVQNRRRKWDVNKGLTNNEIRAIALEKILHGSPIAEAFLWIGTSNGLNRAALTEKIDEQLPIAQFTGNDLLPDDEIQTLLVRRNGTVLIGTPNGLWAYQPSQLSPQLRLRLNSGRRTDQLVTLAYDDVNPLEFIGGDLTTAAGNLIYRYQIDDGEQNKQGWLLTGKNTLAITKVVQPDETINLTAWAYDQDFNESKPVSVAITRQAVPWLRRPWFLGAMAVLLVGGTFTLNHVARTWALHGYHDLTVIVTGGADLNTQSVHISMKRSLFKFLLDSKELASQKKLNRSFSLDINLYNQTTLNWDLLQQRLTAVSADKTDDALLRVIGEQLYQALFSPEVTTALLRYPGLGKTGVRLKLQFDNAPHLAALPWEFIHGGDGLRFLTVESDVTLVRDLSLIQSGKQPRTQRPLKLLIAWATPQDLDPLDLTEEVDAVQSTFAKSGDSRAQVDILEHAQPENFTKAIQQGYDMIHFIGHGGIKDGTGVLYLEDEDGDSVSMAQRELIALLAETHAVKLKTPKLFVLNACRTAEPANQSGLTSLAATLVSEGKLPAVVGMGYTITTDSAAVFSRAFYTTLVRHGQVDYAIAQGRAALFAEVGAGKRDWGVPRLYMHAPTRVIFDL